jgi:hypothetical protein
LLHQDQYRNIALKSPEEMRPCFVGGGGGGGLASIPPSPPIPRLCRFEKSSPRGAPEILIIRLHGQDLVAGAGIVYPGASFKYVDDVNVDEEDKTERQWPTERGYHDNTPPGQPRYMVHVCSREWTRTKKTFESGFVLTYKEADYAKCSFHRIRIVQTRTGYGVRQACVIQHATDQTDYGKTTVSDTACDVKLSIAVGDAFTDILECFLSFFKLSQEDKLEIHFSAQEELKGIDAMVASQLTQGLVLPLCSYAMKFDFVEILWASMLALRCEKKDFETQMRESTRFIIGLKTIYDQLSDDGKKFLFVLLVDPANKEGIIQIESKVPEPEATFEDQYLFAALMKQEGWSFASTNN